MVFVGFRALESPEVPELSQFPALVEAAFQKGFHPILGTRFSRAQGGTRFCARAGRDTFFARARGACGFSHVLGGDILK